MKKLLFLILTVIVSMSVNAQTINENGLYVDSEGGLFSGTITKTQNGVKSEFEVKEGRIDGTANYYFASGKLMESGVYNKGEKDQKWVRYTESGNVSAIAFYNLGKKTGTWLVFDEKGNKRFEMNYLDGNKTGVWTNWDENGAVAGTKDYSKAY